MSGLAGIYNLDGSPVDRALLQRMVTRLAHRGPDGMGTWINGPIGMAHLMMHTTPEAVRERQPLCNETGTMCLTLDGRLDNREDLRRQLEGAGAELRSDTDAELVLQAYECWGEDCLIQIVGDFAFAIGDQRRRRLFCARDFLGLKPFYYYCDGRSFLWASELAALFENPTLQREPNEGMIAEYLAGAITDQEETLYRGLFRLPPAHHLSIDADGLRKERYWDFDPVREIRHRTDREYAEHFSQLFQEVVQCRLRSPGPVAAELSGGLDSSSIVGMVQALQRDGRVPDAGFETFSLVFPGRPCDESAYIQEVVQKWGVRSNTQVPCEPDLSIYSQLVRRYQDFPGYPNGALWEPLLQLARAKGFRIMLTGVGGDDWLTGSFYHLADLLRRLRLPTLIRQLRFGTRVPSVSFPKWPLLSLGVWPLLPRPMRHAIKRILKGDGGPSWIAPRFARNVSLADRLSREPAHRRFTSLAQQDLYLGGTHGGQTHGNELGERSASWLGCEQRHPFQDRRLVEFALALPEEQRWRRDQPKFILRQAMHDLLPETVRTRLTKADFCHPFAETLPTAEMRRHLESSIMVALGWVNRDEIGRMFREMVRAYERGDESYTTHVWELWMIVAIDIWFEIMFLGPAATPPITCTELSAARQTVCTA